MKNSLKEKPKTCVFYCRVSTAKQAQDGDSWSDQTKACQAYADRNGLKLMTEPFLEAYSGRADSRPKFDEMMGYLLRNLGKVGYVIIYDISRLTRGGSASYAILTENIRKLGVEVRDTFGIIQEEINIMEQHGDLVANYRFATKRSSKISEDMYAQVKQDQVDEMLARLISREINLTQAGYWIGIHPYGFKSEKQRETSGDGKKRTVLIPKDGEAEHIRELFRLCAENILSDQQIIAKINAMGYRSRVRVKRDADGVYAVGKMGGKKLDEQQMDKILQHPIYAGIICKMWTRYHNPSRLCLMDLLTWILGIRQTVARFT